LGGIHIVDGITKVGSEEAPSVLTPEFLALVPLLFSSNRRLQEFAAGVWSDKASVARTR